MKISEQRRSKHRATTSSGCPRPASRRCCSKPKASCGICIRCLADDVEDGLVDVLGVYATCEDAEWDLLMEEYYASLEPPDLDVADVPAWAEK